MKKMEPKSTVEAATSLHAARAHEHCKSLLRKHPIDSDANFQVEVEAHGDKNLMNDGQYHYFTFSREI